jgi:alanyl-tRNA synthetase
VFIQYNRKIDGSLELLPSKHVDTGMGFERLCMVVQGKKSNYDTDIFQSVIGEISKLTGLSYGRDGTIDTAMRVIADHSRAVAFAIADGQLPSNNKAGYVIRRILRRAVRYSYNHLGQSEPFIYKLVPILETTMGDEYPELRLSSEQVKKIILEEETAFLNTLGKGLKMINKVISGLREEKKNLLPGRVGFELYDTFGFPVDLTRLILKEKGMKLDEKAFEKEMSKQKERSREDASLETGDWIILTGSEKTLFTGYERTEESVRITRLRRVRIKGKEVCQLVLDKTPFYAESGGQIGDTGHLVSEKERIEIIDTIKENNLFIHVAGKTPADPRALFSARVDTARRVMAANNHTATHLLHFALRSVLGEHVEQKGSLVTPDRLRFDFSHFTRLGREEIQEVEKIANGMVRENIALDVIADISPEKAKSMGALALFGEKYGDSVRVVRFGNSIELCGGTHAPYTSSVGMIKIISEGAIAAGIRRIEAVTALKAEEYINERLGIIEEITAMFKNTGPLKENVEKLIAENSNLKKIIEKQRIHTVIETAKKLVDNAIDINGIRLITGIVESDSPDMLKAIAFELRKSSPDTVAVIGSASNKKASIVVAISDKPAKAGKINANDIIKEISPEIDGGGGGQPFLATAGGKNPSGIQSALRKAEKYIRKNIT